MNSSRVSALDGWRGISIALVLAGHLLPLGPKSWNLNVAVAGSGMAIFFTLSGCLITSVLLRDDNVRNFLIRRLMRIVPLAWLATIVTLGLTGASADRWLPHLFFYANTGPMWLTNATGHFWSLCVEVQFYVMIALLVLAFGRRALYVLPLVAVGVTLLRLWEHKAMVINTPYRIDEILTGCTLALVLHRYKGREPIDFIGLVPWIGLPLLVLSAHPAGAGLNYFRPYIASVVVGSSLFAGSSSITVRLLSSPLLAYLAKISYALYIIHGCLMTSWLGTGDTLAKYAKRPLFFAVTFALAHLSTTYYESFFIALGKRWTAGSKSTEPLIPTAVDDESPGPDNEAPLRILIVSEHASTRFGGEAALAYHYFRVMHQRGLDVRLLTHARVRDELTQAFPDAGDRLLFVDDSTAHRVLWRLGKFLPHRVASFSTGFVARVITQQAQRRIARRLVREAGVQVVHQPMPVSPREPSLMHGIGVPVVIGPLNGNMEFPPAFREAGGYAVGAVERLGRRASGLMNTLFPGKRRAAAILVANERTGQALPDRLEGRVVHLPENGVDLTLWRTDGGALQRADTPLATKFIYMGRLVDWKAVDLLLLAFQRACQRAPISLTIIGDGVERIALQSLAKSMNLEGESAHTPGKVHFAGWLSQQECAARLAASDVLVLPSLWECGGAVVLEAMASRIPVIATAWGGPLDYLDDRSGVLVPPQSREQLIQGFADAMVDLDADPQRRMSMGMAGRARIERDFDWERKVDRIISLYREVIGAAIVRFEQHAPAST